MSNSLMIVSRAWNDWRLDSSRALAQRVRLLVVAATLTAAVVITPIGTFAQAGGGGITPTPEQYSEYLVLIADGVFDPAATHPEVAGCDESLIFCDGEHFQKEVMGRTDAEIAEKEAEAKGWFAQRFGIDVDDPADAARVDFFMWTADPRWNYRVYTWSGRNVPSGGYEVRDGGWAVMVTDPDGYTLGGELDGVEVAEGDMAVFGEYNILTTNPAGNDEQPVVRHYRANSFMEFTDLGHLTIDCQIARDGFEDGHEGLAQGLGTVAFDEDGNVDFNSKNVITFDP